MRALLSGWKSSSGGGWTADTRDRQFWLAAVPPAPGRVGTGVVTDLAGRVEAAFDMTLNPGTQSKESVNLACQDTDSAGAPFNFLLIDNVTITKL